MKKKEIIQLILAGVLIPLLGYLAYKVSDIDANIRTVDAKVGDTSRRVDRIADALPDIHVRVAAEEIHKPIQAAVITTTPRQEQGGKWIVNVHVIDPVERRQTTYEVALTNQSDRHAIYAMKGASVEVEPSVTTLDKLSMWSSSVKDPRPLPSFVDGTSSLVFHKTSADVVELRVQEIGGHKVSIHAIKGQAGDWIGLSQVLKEQSAQFRPTE